MALIPIPWSVPPPSIRGPKQARFSLLEGAQPEKRPTYTINS
jgi:hypothetical protein